MGANTREVGMITNSMVMVNSCGMMEPTTQGNTIMDLNMDGVD